jgi:hypothetical protein
MLEGSCHSPVVISLVGTLLIAVSVRSPLGLARGQTLGRRPGMDVRKVSASPHESERSPGRTAEKIGAGRSRKCSNLSDQRVLGHVALPPAAELPYG